jgi:HSP20 family molecular chaperone IbpA
MKTKNKQGEKPMTNTLSFNTLFDDILYKPSRLKFEDTYNNYTHRNGLYESKVNDDGLLEITINATGHDKKDITIDVTDTHIKVTSIKPENSSLFVRGLDLSLKVGEEYDGTTTTAEFNNGLLTLSVDTKEERKSKRIKLS